jgi:RNA polymerase sigma-70 factor (ECF subfamily)
VTEPRPPASPRFETTHWSVVLAAARSHTTGGRDSLARLCRAYWYPLYAFVRRRGHAAEDAKDLTQEFFSRLLEKNWIADADKTKGRFRTFLLSAMTHFLADERDKSRAVKRGGGVPLLTLDGDDARARYLREPADSDTPEKIFELNWALTVLDQVLRRLRDEHERAGRGQWFAALYPCLVGDRASQPYASLAATLGVSEGTIKSAVHRLRQRYRQILREEIASTVDGPEAVDEELRYLATVLGR